MVKKRVHELAREFNLESKDLIKKMAQLGVELKSHMSTIEDNEVDLFTKSFRKDPPVPEPQPVPQPPKASAVQGGVQPNAEPRREAVSSAERPRERAPEKPGDRPRPVPSGEDRRRQDKRDPRSDHHRYERGPGMVDRVPSRPPDRRFEDRSAATRPLPPHKVASQQPVRPPQRVHTPSQQAAGPAATPASQSGQPALPVKPAAPVERRPVEDKSAVAKDHTRYPDRSRPVPQKPYEQRGPRPPADRDQRGQAPRYGPGPDARGPRPPGEQQRGFQQRDRAPVQGPGRVGPEISRPRPEADRTRKPGAPDDRPMRPRPEGFDSARPAQPGKGVARPRPDAIKVPKVPEQLKAADKIKASEKSRARIQQTQARSFAKAREKIRTDDTVGERSLRSPYGKKKGSFKSKNDQRMAAPLEKKPVVIGETVTVQDLAEKMKKSPAELIKKLMLMGVLATINQEIDTDTATLLASEYGFEVEIKIHLDAEQKLEQQQVEEDKTALVYRPCVVTVMGHVDHGKTSLLDAIRETNVIATEAGGITQHIGAYQVEYNNKRITFVDTPGHEAFTAMRARGAQVTDIAILVVAADDGVMPQTVEAINHAKAADVPIIVAINKMDKPGAAPDRVKQQLTEYGLVSEEWGGDTISVQLSAKEKTGLSELLEMILLVSEMAELKADPTRLARGTVIEAELDKGRGPVANILVQNGTLKIGDGIVAGTAFGRVRAMMDDKGRRIKKAPPSTPVEVLGFHDVPQAGDVFYAVNDEKTIREIVEKRTLRKKQEELKTPVTRVTLDDLFSHIKEGQVKELNLIVKADVQGSVEAVRQSLEKLSTGEVKVNIIHGGVGAITESDTNLAATSNAIIIGFNVRPDVNARKLAEIEKVDIRLYRVIYDAIDDIKAAMSGLLDPELKEVILGRAEIRKIFKVSKVGTIAGSYVSEGKISRDAGVRLIRDNVVVFEGKLDSLKRFKDDAREVLQGYECGVTLENYNDMREGDIIEAYTTEKIKRELA